MNDASSVKIDAQDWVIKEQIVDDLVTELTFQFERIDNDPDCPMRMRIFGKNLPFGNREILFSKAGIVSASGTALADSCGRPTWLTDVNKLFEPPESN